jgi:hypothetical protein
MRMMKTSGNHGWRGVRMALVAVLLAVGLGAGCKTENLRERPEPAQLAFRWADGSRVESLILVNVNGLPFKSLTKYWNSWERSQTVGLTLGGHDLIVRLPQEVIDFGYKEVRKKNQWVVRAKLTAPGNYTAYLDLDSELTPVVSDDTGERVDVAPPVGDPRGTPGVTNAPPATSTVPLPTPVM